jgi:hypothetical protein
VGYGLLLKSQLVAVSFDLVACTDSVNFKGGRNMTLAYFSTCRASLFSRI